MNVCGRQRPAPESLDLAGGSNRADRPNRKENTTCAMEFNGEI
jgi:hypothetical protein